MAVVGRDARHWLSLLDILQSGFDSRITLASQQVWKDPILLHIPLLGQLIVDMYLSRSLSISSRLADLLACNCSWGRLHTLIPNTWEQKYVRFWSWFLFCFWNVYVKFMIEHP